MIDLQQNENRYNYEHHDIIDDKWKASLSIFHQKEEYCVQYSQQNQFVVIRLDKSKIFVDKYFSILHNMIIFLYTNYQKNEFHLKFISSGQVMLKFQYLIKVRLKQINQINQFTFWKNIMSIQEFTIVKELGSGSFGSVFKVKKKADHKIYAMKQVKLSNLNAKQKQNALNEVRLLASIHTPYIISYKDAFFDQIQNILCIVMEFADGGDLQKQVQVHKKNYTKFDEVFVWKTAFDLLQGAQKLHQNKILHRDIKAANIFFAENIAKLGDLNVSRVIQNQGFAKTQTGTPYYTAPEIWQNQPYGPKCDIWSIGCVIYQMCALVPPFRANDFPGLYRKVKTGLYDKIPAPYSGVLDSFIRRCLQVNPKKRATSQELLDMKIFDKLHQLHDINLSSFQNEIDLLETIRVPRILKQLNNKLPASQYDKKKTVTIIEQESSDIKSKKILDTPKSLKHIKSQKLIPIIVEHHQDKLPEKHERPAEKIESFKIMQEYKLPKIQSVKNILPQQRRIY